MSLDELPEETRLGTAPLNLRWQISDRVFVNERLVHERRGNGRPSHGQPL
jgi:hypothetical protein